MSSTANAPSTPSRKRNPYLWLVGAIGMVYLLSTVILVLVIVTIPVLGWSRAFKIVGLAFNVVGAFASLAPRAARSREQIERDLSMIFGRERLWFDTMLARYGIVIFGVGFIQQLIGNIIG